MVMLTEGRWFEQGPEQPFCRSPYGTEGNKWKRKSERQSGSPPGSLSLVLCRSFLFPSRTDHFSPPSSTTKFFDF